MNGAPRERKKDEREKPLLTKGKTHKVVRFLISPKKKKEKIEVNKIMNPEHTTGNMLTVDWLLNLFQFSFLMAFRII